MKINEVELATGIAKKNIRFYEQEGLVNPSRGTNGYRDYTQEDVELLQQIKLLRKLDIPLAEIKRVQSGGLTLDDCLRRHLIVLERRSKNLEALEGFCNRILAETAELGTLPVEQLLAEMDVIEKGGMKFLEFQSKDKKQKKKNAIISAVVAITLMGMFLAAMLAGVISMAGIEPMPGFPIFFAIIVMALPIAGITGTLLALRERFKEIEGGELYEASKY